MPRYHYYADTPTTFPRDTLGDIAIPNQPSYTSQYQGNVYPFVMAGTLCLTAQSNPPLGGDSNGVFQRAFDINTRTEVSLTAGNLNKTGYDAVYAFAYDDTDDNDRSRIYLYPAVADIKSKLVFRVQVSPVINWQSSGVSGPRYVNNQITGPVIPTPDGTSGGERYNFGGVFAFSGGRGRSSTILQRNLARKQWNVYSDSYNIGRIRAVAANDTHFFFVCYWQYTDGVGNINPAAVDRWHIRAVSRATVEGWIDNDFGSGGVYTVKEQDYLASPSLNRSVPGSYQGAPYFYNHSVPMFLFDTTGFSNNPIENGYFVARDNNNVTNRVPAIVDETASFVYSLAGLGEPSGAVATSTHLYVRASHDVRAFNLSTGQYDATESFNAPQGNNAGIQMTGDSFYFGGTGTANRGRILCVRKKGVKMLRPVVRSDSDANKQSLAQATQTTTTPNQSPPNDDRWDLVPDWENNAAYNADDYVRFAGDNRLYQARINIPAPSGGTTYTHIATWNDGSRATAQTLDYNNHATASICARRVPLTGNTLPNQLNFGSDTYRLRYVPGGSATQAAAEVVGTITPTFDSVSQPYACFRVGTAAEMLAAFGTPAPNSATATSPTRFHGGQWILERVSTGSVTTNNSPPQDTIRWRYIQRVTAIPLWDATRDYYTGSGSFARVGTNTLYEPNVDISGAGTTTTTRINGLKWIARNAITAIDRLLTFNSDARQWEWTGRS